MQPEGSIIEVCYVTRDLDRAIDHWSKLFGAGPFFAFDVPAGPGQTNRGEPSNIDLRVAFGFSGGLLIELLQPLNDVPSIFREVLDTRGEGYHHIMPRGDFDANKARLEAHGYVAAFTGRMPSGERIAVYDTQDGNGGFVELMDLTAATFGPMSLLRDVHANWDGKTEPKRDFYSFMAAQMAP